MAVALAGLLLAAGISAPGAWAVELPPTVGDNQIIISGNVYLLALTYYAGTMCAEIKREDEAKIIEHFSQGLKAALADYARTKRDQVHKQPETAPNNSFAFLLIPDDVLLESSRQLSFDTARLWKQEFGCSSELAQGRIASFFTLLQDIGLSQRYLDEYVERLNEKTSQ